MKHIGQKLKNVSKKKRILLIILTTTLLAGVSWFTYLTLKPESIYPLGSKIEYLGKREYGCYGICDSYPTTIYSYATDMSPEEIVQYFKNVRYDIDNQSDFIGIELDIASTNNPIYITYYENGRNHHSSSPLKEKTHKHIMELNQEDYEAARDSL